MDYSEIELLSVVTCFFLGCVFGSAFTELFRGKLFLLPETRQSVLGVIYDLADRTRKLEEDRAQRMIQFVMHQMDQVIEKQERKKKDAG